MPRPFSKPPHQKISLAPHMQTQQQQHRSSAPSQVHNYLESGRHVNPLKPKLRLLTQLFQSESDYRCILREANLLAAERGVSPACPSLRCPTHETAHRRNRLSQASSPAHPKLRPHPPPSASGCVRRTALHKEPPEAVPRGPGKGLAPPRHSAGRSATLGASASCLPAHLARPHCSAPAARSPAPRAFLPPSAMRILPPAVLLRRAFRSFLSHGEWIPF